MSNNKSPIFPMPAEPHHFSDYGFDPQLDYFQMVEEARNQQRETLSRFIDDISNDKKKKKKMKRRWWWNKAFTTFLKWTTKPTHLKHDNEDRDVHMARARAFRSNFSGPLYMADSSRPTHRSQPLIAGLLSPGGGGTGSGCSSPYLSLRELNMERQHLQRMSASASPIYLVT